MCFQVPLLPETVVDAERLRDVRPAVAIVPPEEVDAGGFGLVIGVDRLPGKRFGRPLHAVIRENLDDLAAEFRGEVKVFVMPSGDRDMGADAGVCGGFISPGWHGTLSLSVPTPVGCHDSYSTIHLLRKGSLRRYLSASGSQFRDDRMV